MASTIFNASSSLPATLKGLDCNTYKPTLGNLRFIASPNKKSITVPSSSSPAPKRRVLPLAKATSDVPVKTGLSDAECEAAVAAGNVPEAPPVPPTPLAPAGTPVVPSLPLSRRPRRNRRSPALRAAFQETSISPANFVYPLFIHEGEEDTPIGAMPGCYRLGWRHGLLEEVAKARDVGVNSIVLFPKVPDALKTPTGDEAYNEHGLVPRTIRLLKDKFPGIVIYTDVALDPYSSDGHDGIVREDGVIMNDETVHQLCKQAVAQGL
ncbi:unnamed protein product [Linum tenue]|uniref:porphobilinogen synthase n=1 Tax=Linum tenue TaxID=586396 RepID=A0AAV0IDR0_9ROSI|nr:unnamed protein product [Linum tenue]CAI0395631.1 unnamed protein product [Linum tenue]